MVSAIIMASGFSSRMKKDKLLLDFRGEKIIEHIIKAALKCDFSRIILVARKEDMLALGKQYGLILIENKNAHRGISESVKLGISNAGDCDGYIFFTADQPLLTADTIQKLLDAFYEEKTYIIVPKYNERQGSPVVFPKKYKEDLMRLEGDTGGRAVINEYPEQVRFVEVDDEKNLFDIDTLEDYKKVLKYRV